MAIKNTRDTRINVKPITLALQHEYVFEGPCRFGQGDQLKTEFDEMANAQSHRDFVERLNRHLDREDVNILEPLFVARDENFLVPQAMIEEIGRDRDEVDLYWMNPVGFETMTEMLQYYDIHTPLAMMEPCCSNPGFTATCWARGIEAYAFNRWDEALQTIRVLRVRKMLHETRVLCVSRNKAVKSIGIQESFLDFEQVTAKLGVRFYFYNMHEMLDQIEHVPADQNHTLPGRRMLNLTDGEIDEASRRTDRLVEGAVECGMDRDYVQRSVEANMVVNKLLDFTDCNAFTADCPEMCATRRLNEDKYTLCLNHSLNLENGIASACEYDVVAAVSMIILSGFSKSSAYMGNTATTNVGEGISALSALIKAEDRERYADYLKSHPNVFYSFHSVPTRKLRGYDAPDTDYALRPFAYSGWGATFRHDFGKDEGQTITMCRLDPTCSKLFVARGTIVGGFGYDHVNCSEGVLFEVDDGPRYEQGQAWVGNHIPLVYGDCYDDLISFAKIMGLETITA